MASGKRRNSHGREGKSQALSPSREQQSNTSSKRQKFDQNSKDEEWQTVPSRHRGRDSATSTSPSIRYHQNYKTDIRIKDLRDLVLYILTPDFVSPNWIAINGSKNVRKVVTLMVPGLDHALLEEGRQLFSRTDQDTVKDDGRLELNSLYELQDWLFKNVLNVRAPGDAKQSRVHSPLQAMLLYNDQTPQTKENGRSSHSNSSTTNATTPITEFVHTAEELREAGYPIHPATFTSHIDASLEAERRQATGQSAKDGWVDTAITTSSEQLTNKTDSTIRSEPTIYALDCEMVLTSDDVSSLARVTFLSWPKGDIILDSYVKPSLPIINYFTQYSGITPSILEDVDTTLPEIQSRLLDLITPDTILLGHSLESDLNALKMTHPHIIDTALIYPHPRGLPLRSSLKYLANKYLKREIQKGPGVAETLGHDSREDARAVLDLVMLKCKRGPAFGTMEGLGEPIFNLLNRHGKNGAMVEYGTPERGYGKDARWTIGCQDDDEIVEGVRMAANGEGAETRSKLDRVESDTQAVKSENSSSQQPADAAQTLQVKGGPISPEGADFIWARLRALEHARGWTSGTGEAGTNSAPTQSTTNAKVNQEAGSNATEETQSTENTVRDTLVQTLQRISTIRRSLPPRTLLIVFSGTGDVRPVLRLQAIQTQYRKEFKTKKWDELSVRWTDNEEQELRRACDKARDGWGVVTIT